MQKSQLYSVTHASRSTVKPVYKSLSQKYRKLVFKTNYHLMQVKSIGECSKGSILQYLRPSLSYHLSLRSFVLSIFEWPFYTGYTVIFYDYRVGRA